MAKLTALPSQAIIAGFKGTVDFYEWRGIPVARRWPRSPRSPRAPAVQAQYNRFIYAAREWPNLSPTVQEAYKKMSQGSGLSGRDIFMKGYIKGIYGYPHYEE
jgi:hypothetical protein